MNHDNEDNYAVEPSFNFDYSPAQLMSLLETNTFGSIELKWLDDNIPFFDTGIYHFKANDWFPLACKLAEKGIRNDLWAMCCKDLQFIYSLSFLANVKFSDPTEVRDLVTNWFYVHLNKKIAPQWNAETQMLHSVSNLGSIKPTHVYAVLNAFATPELVAEVHRGIAINQSFGIAGCKPVFSDINDTWRFSSWLLSPAVLGNTIAVDTLTLPDLDSSTHSI